MQSSLFWNRLEVPDSEGICFGNTADDSGRVGQAMFYLDGEILIIGGEENTVQIEHN